MDQSEEDDIEDCFVYWDCENDHLWACQPGPVHNTWILEQLHQTTLQERLQLNNDTPRRYHMAAVSPAICPDCGCRMFPVEVVVNGELKGTRWSEV